MNVETFPAFVQSDVERVASVPTRRSRRTGKIVSSVTDLSRRASEKRRRERLLREEAIALGARLEARRRHLDGKINRTPIGNGRERLEAERDVLIGTIVWLYGKTGAPPHKDEPA